MEQMKLPFDFYLISKNFVDQSSWATSLLREEGTSGSLWGGHCVLPWETSDGPF